MNRKPRVLAKFTDDFGDKRTVHRKPNGALAVRREGLTPSLAMTHVAASHVGRRIRELRKSREWTMMQLATRSGIRGGKQQVRAIEEAANGGVRLGTLYCIASALGVGVADLLPSQDQVMEEAEVYLGEMTTVHHASQVT
jgi:DNA-binding Xre family transcriptional regulator